MRFFKALAAAFQRLAMTVIRSPIDFLTGLLGLGGPHMPDTPADFIAPGSTSELVAQLTNGHHAKAAAPSLESQAVTAIYKMRNARSDVNLSAVEKRDVRDLLIGMSATQIENLCNAGRPAIQRLLRTGDSGIMGVPMTEIASLKSLRAEMAKTKGSKPFGMPTMPAM